MEQAEAQIIPNPADRPFVTFDTNIIYSLRNNEPDAQPARQLLALYRASVITINITLSTALEERRADEEQEMHEYAAWLQEQGIEPGNIFTHSRTMGFQLPGDPPKTITFAPHLELWAMERVHRILFPNIPFRWFDYREQECTRLGIVGTRRKALVELDALGLGVYIPLSPLAPARRPTPTLDTLEQIEQEELSSTLNRLKRTWMNAKNDALGLYSHISHAIQTTYPERAVFVTGDRNFRKKTKLLALRQLGLRGEILPPTEAVAFICKVTGASLQETEPGNPMVI